MAGAGGPVRTPDTTSGDVVAEVGVRIAPGLMAFGDVGQFHNLQPSDVVPSADDTTAQLAAQGLDVTDTGRVPAWYSIGGLRFETAPRHHLVPYVIGGLGATRLRPDATFLYTSGTLPDGTTSTMGTEVTQQIVAAGFFTPPANSTAFMYTLGGGVEIPMARHLAVDVGYRFSRVQADTPVNAQGVAFGLG